MAVLLIFTGSVVIMHREGQKRIIFYRVEIKGLAAAIFLKHRSETASLIVN